jgi:hypothetical protein
VPDAGDGTERAQRAFDHAVAREWEAIAVHESAAEIHEATAEVLAQAAATEPDPARAGRFAERTRLR